MPRRRLQFLVLVAYFAAGAAAQAELLYFRSGGQIQAPAKVTDGLVQIKTGLGVNTFRVNDFERIVPGHDAAGQWPAVRDAARKGTTTSRLDAAWWALENGLVDAAESMIKEAHAADPGDHQSERLAAVVEGIKRVLPEPDLQAVRRALGVSCAEMRGQLVCLLHQHPDRVARQRLEALDAVARAYYLLFAFQGRELPLPREQAISVYLRDRSSYLTFLESQNAGAFRSTQGYYHPTLHVVVAYDARTLRLDAGRSDSEPTGRVGDDADWRRLLKALDESDRDLGIASHELIHLLVYASRFDGEPRRLPCWFHEGFAAQFEVYRAGRWAGIGRAHDLRLPDWRALPAPPTLASLVRDEGFGHGYKKGLYAQSWALVRFLRRTRQSELLAFVDLLSNPDGTPFENDGDRFLARFRSAFGDDLNALETEWQRATGACQTPLEEAAPPGRRAAR